MKIDKYRYLSNGRYKVTIDNKDYILYEDVILKYNILALKEIEYDKLKEYLKDNDYYEAYYLAIKYINVKLRTPLEIEKHLLKNNYSKDIINKVITKLQTLKYLDDNRYLRIKNDNLFGESATKKYRRGFPDKFWRRKKWSIDINQVEFVQERW